MARNTNTPSSKRQSNNSFNAHDNDFARVPSGNQQIEQKKDNALSGDLAEIVKAIQLSCDRTTAIFSAITGIDVSKNKDYDSLKGEAKKQGNIIKNILESINKEEFLVKAVKKLNSAHINVSTKNPILEDFFYGENADDFETILARYLNKDNLGLNLPDANHLTGPIEDYLKNAFGSNGYFFENFFNKLAPQKSGVKDFGSLADYYVKEFSKANNINDQKTTKNDLDDVIKVIKEEIDLIQNFYQSNSDNLKNLRSAIKGTSSSIPNPLPKQTQSESSIKGTRNINLSDKEKVKLGVDIINLINGAEINRTTKKNVKEFDKMFNPKTGHLSRLLSNISQVNLQAKKDQSSNIQGIANYLQAVLQLGGIDEKGMKQMKKNFRELDWLFMDPGMLTRMRIWDKGLLTMLIHDIDERCADIKSQNNKTREIKIFIDSLIKVGNDIDSLSIKKLYDNLDELTESFETDGPLMTLIKSLNHIAALKSFKKLTDGKENSPISMIKHLMYDISDIGQSVKSKDVMDFNKALLLSSLSGKLIQFQAKQWTNIDITKIEDQKTKIEVIKDVIKAYNGIFTDNKRSYKSTSSIIKDLIALTGWSMLLALLVKDHTKTWDNINEDSFLNTGVKIETLKDFVDAYSKVYGKKKPENINGIIKSLISMEFLSNILAITVGLNNKIWDKISEENLQKTLDKTQSALQGIASLGKEVKTDDIDKTKEAISAVLSIESDSIIASIIASPATTALDFLAGDKVSYIEALNKFVNKLNDIEELNDDVVDKIDNVKNAISDINKLSLYSVVGMVLALPAMLGFAMMMLEIKELSKFVKVLNDNKDLKISDDIKDKIKEIKTLVEDVNEISIMGALALPLAIPGILGFMAMAGEIWALSKITKLFTTIEIGDDVKKNIEGVQNLVKSSAEILVIGAVVGTLATLAFPSIMMFEFVLATFIMATIGVYNLATEGMEDAFKGAKDFTELIVMSSVVLLVGGGLFTMFPQMIPGVILFGAILTGFVWAVTKVYVNSAKDIKKSFGPAEEFTMLVAVSGAILALGSLFITDKKRFFGALGFAFILGVFVLGITQVYKLAANEMKHSMRAARGLIELIGVSAALLLIGGAFMMIDGMPLAVLEFAVLLGAFVGGITFIFGLAAKSFKKKTQAAMIGLMGLVVASSGVLLAAGYLISSGKIKIADIFAFLLAEGVMIGGMAIAVNLLASIPKTQMRKGEIAMLGIIGLIGLLNLAMAPLAIIVNMVRNKMDTMWAVIGAAFTMLAGIGVAAIGLGVLATTGIGGVALAAGEAALAGIVSIIGLLGIAMKKIAESMLLFEKVGKINFKPIYDNIDGYVGILWHLKPFMITGAIPLLGIAMMAGINNAISAITKMSIMISLMAKAVHDIAALTIPIYDGIKVVGYRNLDDNDFDNAAENVKKIVTVLGGAIIDAYNSNKEMFSTGLVGDLLGTNTPFEIVVRSCTKMGNMIAKIAGGVKDMAELRVPIYKGTEVVGYRRLGDKDFDLAATNVKKIIETLGGAIIDLYNSDDGKTKAMFHDDTWYSALTGPSSSNTPFAIVIKASRGLGSLISEISKGIKDMAELRVPVYTGTKITGYRELKDADFTKAQTNVGKVLTALANGVYQTYLGHEDMFTDTSNWHTRASATPMGMVIGSMNGIGKLLSEISDVLGNVAELQFPIYDENGNKTNKFKKIKLAAIQRGGTVYKNIAALISIIPQAICDMYNDNGSDGKSPIKELFEEDFSIGKFFRGTSAKKTKIGIITYAINESTKMLTSVAESIDKLLKLKINTSNLQTTINTLLSSIPSGIQSAAYDNEGNLKEIFKNDDDLSTIENAFDSYKSIIKSITSTYTTTNDAFNKLDSKDPKAKMKLITGMINNAISRLTATFHRVLTYNFSSDAMSKLGDVEDAFDTYKDIIKKVFDVYSSANDLIDKFKSNISENLTSSSKKVKEVGMNKVSGFVDSIDNRIQKMLTNSINNVNIINTKFKDTGALKTFAESLDYYKNGLQLLFATYENAPEDMRKYENVIKAIKKVNIEIASVGKTEEFKAETTEMSLFTHSINSINIQKAHTMQDLISAIEQMAVRLGGLDSLTDALANKLAVVLDKLVRELKESAKTINKADEMQKKRHDAIKKSITTINQLMAKPINVEVKQLPMDDPNQNSIIPPPAGQKPSNGAGGAGSGNDGVSDLNNTNEGNGNTGSQGGKQNQITPPKPKDHYASKGSRRTGK